MFATPQSSLKIGLVALALACASSSGNAADAVQAGFDRLLSPVSVGAGTPPAPSSPVDPLVAALVVPLRDGNRPPRHVNPTDPVAEGFARMLAHEPSRTTPALPAGAGADPLIAAMVWPLLRTNLYSVAGVAPAARH